MKTLRPHQTRAIEMLRQSLISGRKRPILQAATGFGKTLVAAEIIRTARAKGTRVAFIVDAVSLIDQTVKAFYEHGIRDMGVIQADHPMENWSLPVQIASVQTLERRGMPNVGLVIVDECHGRSAWLHEKMSLPEWAKVPFIGLSATPWAKGLGNIYDDLLVPIEMQELIDGGFLCPFRVFAPHDPDLKGVKTVAGEFHQKQLGKVMNDDGLVADVVQTWVQRSEMRPTLVFAVDRAHAKKLQMRFEQAGYAFGYIDAYTDRDERNEIRKQLDRRAIYGVCNVGTLVKGVDWAIGCISDAAPTKSEMRFVQKFGRGLRVNPEAGPDLIYLDHAGNTLRLGFPTDIHHPTLCTKVKGEKDESDGEEGAVPLPKACPMCSYMKPAKVSQCPACGFKPEPVSKIEEQEGKLVELKRKAKKGESPADKEHFYRELLSIQRDKGKSAGWPDALFKAKWGHWPARKHGLAPLTPTIETLGFVKHRAIAYAKGKQRAA